MENEMTIPHLIEILLVEDNMGDIELTQEAFQEMKICNQLHIARDGEEALDFLYRRGNYGDAVRPDIILMDLNMPKKNGKEVLEAIKQDEILKDIPVVMLTSSDAERDIVKSYQLHANAYVVKPVDFQQFMYVMQTVENFWLGVVKLPSKTGRKG